MVYPGIFEVPYHYQSRGFTVYYNFVEKYFDDCVGKTVKKTDRGRVIAVSLF